MAVRPAIMLLLVGLWAAACGDQSGGASEGDGGASDAGSDGGASPDAGPSCTPQQVHLVGRTDDSDPGGPRFAWSGSQIRAQFTGTSLSVKLFGGAFFDVLVDGVARPRLETNWGSAPYLVVSGLAEGTHQVLLHQRSEAFYGPTQFLGFVPQAGHALVASSDCASRRIEFIGDSITCGYGVEGANPYCGFSQATENHALTYAALAARALGAEGHTVAWSGKGVLRNNDGSSAETMPILWSRAIPTDSASRWDFSRWTPEAVVIDLGTNDFAQGIPPKADFNGAYGRFLDDLRGHYPGAFLFVAIGPMLSGDALTALEADLGELVASRRAAGDLRIALVEFAVQDIAVDGAGCDWHPSAKTNQHMADALVAAFQRALSW